MDARRTKRRVTCVSGQKDRRVRKTTAQLQDALHALISEKPYDEIVVKEILDRADVGRSTFYEHFDGKDELLGNSIEEMLLTPHAAPVPSDAQWYEPMLRFSPAILQYHERHRASRRDIAASDMQSLHDRLHRAIAEVIARTAPVDFSARLQATGKPSPALVVEMIASTFMLTFREWLAQDPPGSSEQADATFRSLVVPVLAAL